MLCPNFRKIRAQYSTLSESLGTVQHFCGSRGQKCCAVSKLSEKVCKSAVLCPNFRKIRAQYSTLSESFGTVQHFCGSRCPGNCRFAANCRSAGNCRFAANCRLRRLASFSGFGDCPPFPASAAAPFCAAPDPTFSSGISSGVGPLFPASAISPLFRLRQLPVCWQLPVRWQLPVCW